MHDPVDIRRRIERLLARVERRDDYGQLLASGQVVHSPDEVMDVDAWRAEIRRQARADKIKVRTGFNDGIVWALRLHPDPSTHGRDIQRVRRLLGDIATNRPRFICDELEALDASRVLAEGSLQGVGLAVNVYGVRDGKVASVHGNLSDRPCSGI